MFIGKRGKIYEEFVHKFFKGELVADSIEYYDLESKNGLAALDICRSGL